MLDMLKAAGANIVEFDEKSRYIYSKYLFCDQYCGQKSRQMLHRARKMNPDGIVIAG